MMSSRVYARPAVRPRCCFHLFFFMNDAHTPWIICVSSLVNQNASGSSKQPDVLRVTKSTFTEIQWCEIFV